jgi:small subunit ribosomal protein S1
VKSVDPKGAVIQLDDEVEGYLRASEFAIHRVDDLTQELKEGDEVEALITAIDRKNRSIQLSVKAKEQAEQNEAMNRLTAESSSAPATLGDLIKAKLNEQKR